MNKLSTHTIVSVLATLAIQAATFAAAPAWAPFSGGFGTASSPYLIAAPADLAALASLVNAPETNASFAGNHYRLTSDIDLSGYTNWVPIGVGIIRSEARDDALTFRGVFDGSGKKIANLKIVGAGRVADSFQGLGLFGVVDSGVVKNVWLDGVSIGVDAGRVGAIAGAAIAGSVVSDCYVIGNIGGVGSVGGIVGHADGNSTVANCFALGDVSGAERVGGVVGYVYNSAITGCYAVGRVSEVGGIGIGEVAGHVWNGDITDSRIIDPQADAAGMLAILPECLLAYVGVAMDVKNVLPIVAVVGEPIGKIAVGPNPANRLWGPVNFFRYGAKIKKGTLSIYDAQGKSVKKITLADKLIGAGWRQVGSWDLMGRKGLAASEGAYVVKGVVLTADGKKEKVSILLAVR